MALKLYNTLGRRLQTFTPLSSELVKIYTCGPTVYDYPHIGNWRSFIFSDTLNRTLNYLGLKTRVVINITDVDDKTIAASERQGETLQVFTRRYEAAFLAEMREFNLLAPEFTPRATDYLPQMITLISELLAAGKAKKEVDGVYFSLDQDEGYGRLKNIEKNIENNFALWKFWKEADGEVFWEAPFGRGRPGWHTECVAMIRALLGETIDIHTGGTDLIFPHHENELAQALALTGEPLARYWLHSHFVNINNEKMSKSLNNFLTLTDLKKSGIEPLAYRYLVLNAHYQTDLNYTSESIQAASNRLTRLRARLATLPDGGEVSSDLREQFVEAISDNLNLPRALAIISSANLTPADEKSTWLEFDKVFGLDLAQAPQAVEAPAEVQKLIDQRELARQTQNWELADALRVQIEGKNFRIDDTSDGPRASVLG